MLHRLAGALRPWSHKVSLSLALAATLAGLTGCASMPANGGGGGAGGVGEPAPDLMLSGFWDKRPLPLSGYRGKVVLLDIWASWCAPCREELPALDAMAARLRGKGVEVVAVSVDEDRAAAEAFLKRRKNWALTVAHDPTGIVPERLAPPKMPTSYIIDAAGVVRHVNAGYQPGDDVEIERRVLELLR